VQIKNFEYFVVAAEAQSFTEAAEILFTTQSSISKKIIALEKELGVKLFDRSRRTAILTPAGECCLQFAKTILATHGEMVQSMKNMTAKTTNQLRVTFLPVALYYGMLDQLHEFGENNPCVHLRLSEKGLPDILSGLDKGLYEAALLWGQAIDESKYQTLELCRDYMVVLLNKDHPLASMKKISIHQLKEETFLMLGPKTGTMDLCLRACRNIGAFEPKIFHQSNHIESIVESVSKNLGICLMANTPAQSIQRDRLKIVPLLEKITSSLVLARLMNRPVTPMGEQLWAFFDEVSKRTDHSRP